jgi:hypothetical protein
MDMLMKNPIMNDSQPNNVVVNITPQVPVSPIIIPRRKRTIYERYQRMDKHQRFICWCFIIFLIIATGIIGFGIYFGVSLCKIMC